MLLVALLHIALFRLFVVSDIAEGVADVAVGVDHRPVPLHARVQEPHELFVGHLELVNPVCRELDSVRWELRGPTVGIFVVSAHGELTRGDEHLRHSVVLRHLVLGNCPARTETQSRKNYNARWEHKRHRTLADEHLLTSE